MVTDQLDLLTETLKETGYVVLPKLLSEEVVHEFRARHSELVAQDRFCRGGEKDIWVLNVLEKAPNLVLPYITNPLLLSLAERVLGPMVQLDSSVLVGFPSVDVSRRDEATAWHRDRFAHFPLDSSYQAPNTLVTICYLQDMDREVGPLRVLPGTHRSPSTVPDEQLSSAQPDETLIEIESGDAIVFHVSLLHSGSLNTSPTTRYFFGASFNRTWMVQEENVAGPNCQLLLERAQRSGDLRLQRLLGIDTKLHQRLNTGFMAPDEQMWSKWILEDGPLL